MFLSNHAPLQPFVDRLSALSPLSAEDRANLLSLTGQVLQAKANRDIISPGEEVQSVCFVVDGMVGRFGQLRDGRRQITAFYVPGDMADLNSVAVPKTASAIQALSTTTIIRIPLSQLRKLAADHASIAQAFWAYSAVDAAILSQWTVNIGRRAAKGRLAHLLCEMALRMEQANRGDRSSFVLEATQLQLGDALGLTAVHVNRTFKALRLAQLVEIEGRTIRIKNWTGLVMLGDFDLQYLQIEDPLEIAA